MGSFVGAEVNGVFSFLFALVTWNQDDDGKMKRRNLLTSLSILCELTCLHLLTHKHLLCLSEQVFKLIMATVKDSTTAHSLLLKPKFLYFFLRYRRTS